jgi:hypothetical protein
MQLVRGPRGTRGDLSTSALRHGKPPQTEQTRNVVYYCYSRSRQLIAGCDASAYHVCGQHRHQPNRRKPSRIVVKLGSWMIFTEVTNLLLLLTVGRKLLT